MSPAFVALSPFFFTFHSIGEMKLVKADDYVYILGREDVEKEIRARTDGYRVYLKDI